MLGRCRETEDSAESGGQEDEKAAELTHSGSMETGSHFSAIES